MRNISVVLVLVLWCVLAGEKWPTVKCREFSATYNYVKALENAILFFEGQRSGKLPSNKRVKWRGDSALSDGKPDNVSLVGGYYDAGDNVKFGWPMAFSMGLLSWAATEYEKQINSTKQLGNLRAAIKWGTDFMMRSHTLPTTFYTQVGDSNADHNCWERPEDMDTPRTLYKITPESPGTEPAADAAATLAAAALAFKKADSKYSAMLLKKSKSLFEFADRHRGSYQASCPFYCSYSGFQDELLWAAAWLHKATRERKYLNYVLNNQGWSTVMNEFSWDNKFAGAQVLLAQEFFRGKSELEKYKSHAESFICAVMPGSSSRQIKTTPGGLLYIRDSSNLQYVFSTCNLLVIYSKTLAATNNSRVNCGSAQFSASQIRNFAKSQVDYVLGSNPKNMSYMVGFGRKYPQQLHHRGASMPSIKQHPAKIGCNEGFSNYYNANQPNPNVHVGAIVGGPDSNDQFSDSRSDYSHAEPTTYINAAAIAPLADMKR